VEEDFVIAKALIERFLTKNYGILDIGSHEGDFVKFICGEKEIYDNAIMVEPIPEKMNLIRARFPGAKLSQCAVSNVERDAELFVTTNFPKCSALYDRQAYDEVKILNERHTIPVKLRRLDNILNDHDFVNLPQSEWYLKVDTEGFELETIQSLGDFISDKRIVAGQFEYGGCWKERAVKLKDMASMLEQSNFKMLKMHIVMDTMYLSILEDYSDNYEHTNIYFVRNDILSRLS
jgi:FkbM family methyltransferase